jgi:hypothetical protein
MAASDCATRPETAEDSTVSVDFFRLSGRSAERDRAPIGAGSFADALEAIANHAAEPLMNVAGLIFWAAIVAALVTAWPGGF